MSETASVLAKTGCSVSVTVSVHIGRHSFGYGQNWKIQFRSTCKGWVLAGKPCLCHTRGL